MIRCSPGAASISFVPSCADSKVCHSELNHLGLCCVISFPSFRDFFWCWFLGGTLALQNLRPDSFAPVRCSSPHRAHFDAQVWFSVRFVVHIGQSSRVGWGIQSNPHISNSQKNGHYFHILCNSIYIMLKEFDNAQNVLHQ